MTILAGRNVNRTVQIYDKINFRGKTEFSDTNLLGDTYYVKGGETTYTGIGSNSNSGKTPSEAFLTLSYAVSRASAWDKIIVLPSDNLSTYFEAESDLPITITQHGLKIIGGLSSERQWGSPALHSHGTTSLIYINAHQVEIANMGFHLQGAGPAMIEVAATDSYWRNHIHDCYFGGNNAALCGVIMGNLTGSGFGNASTVDAPSTTVERCHFNYINGSSIYMAAGYGSTVRNCSFDVGTADVGISYGTDTTSRPFAYITDNFFTTIDSTNATGIDVVNTPSAGYLFISGNQFVNFASDDKRCTKRTGYMGLNYAGITAVSVTT